MSEEITVLVVDDERSVREGTKALLAFVRGINVVHEACNGQEALQLVTREQPDVVLMDVRMPAMDGLIIPSIFVWPRLVTVWRLFCMPRVKSLLKLVTGKR